MNPTKAVLVVCRLLLEDWHTIDELAEAVTCSERTLHRHLARLEGAGFTLNRRRGTAAVDRWMYHLEAPTP